MANISWTFYRSRRKINIYDLVRSGRVVDYVTYLAYCRKVHVTPTSQQEFDNEFGPALKRPAASKAPETETSAEQSTIPDQVEVLEATVWMAGVGDEASEQPASSPPRQKKKKAKDSDSGSDA